MRIASAAEKSLRVAMLQGWTSGVNKEGVEDKGDEHLHAKRAKLLSPIAD